jgi:hypothetical protein
MTEYKTDYIINSSPIVKKCIYHFNSYVFNYILKLNVKEAEPYAKKVWIAGGSIRDFFNKTPKNDIDLYFNDQATFDFVRGAIRQRYQEKIKLETPNVLKLAIKLDSGKKEVIDLVKMPYSSPASTLDTFDFTVCCAAVTPISMIYHPNFFIDNLSKALYLNRTPNNLGELCRLQKYIQKGYKAPNSTLLALGEAIKEMDLDDPTYNCLQFNLDGTLREGEDREDMDLSGFNYGAAEKEEDIPF